MNTNIRKILVPVDFSECSVNALQYAVKFARLTGSAIDVLHSFEYGSAHMGSRETLLEARGRLKNELDGQVAEIAGGTDILVKTYCKAGPLAEAMEDLINTQNIDLIIMGTHSKNPLKRFLLGSSAIAVLEKAGRPVLLVPPNVEFTGLKHIIFSTNYHSGSVISLKRLVEMIPGLHADITLVHFDLDGQEKKDAGTFKKMVSDEVRYDNISFKEVPAKTLLSGADEYTRSGRADLMVMSNKRRKGLAGFFNTPAEQRAIYTRISLLVIPREPLTLDLSVEPSEIL